MNITANTIECNCPMIATFQSFCDRETVTFAYFGDSLRNSFSMMLALVSNASVEVFKPASSRLKLPPKYLPLVISRTPVMDTLGFLFKGQSVPDIEGIHF